MKLGQESGRPAQVKVYAVAAEKGIPGDVNISTRYPTAMLTRVILRPVHIKVLLNAISVIRRIVHHEIEPGAVAGISSAVARNGVAILKKGVAFNEWIPAIMPCIHTVTETIPPVVMDKIARAADGSWNSSCISRRVIDPGLRKEPGDRNGRH